MASLWLGNKFVAVVTYFDHYTANRQVHLLMTLYQHMLHCVGICHDFRKQPQPPLEHYTKMDNTFLNVFPILMFFTTSTHFLLYNKMTSYYIMLHHYSSHDLLYPAPQSTQHNNNITMTTSIHYL